MTPEEKKARLEELLAKTSLTPEEETELTALKEELTPLAKEEDPKV